MRVWTQTGGFGPEHLAITQREKPEPTQLQVRVRVLAVSLNYRDLMLMRGTYDPRLPMPRVPLSDAVAIVDALGPGSTRFALGDRVCPIFALGYLSGEATADTVNRAAGHRIDGVMAEYLVIDEASLVLAPAHLSPAQAATLPCAAVTAWNALTSIRPVKAGDTVVVQGTGGVSLFALQLAKAFGAKVIATSGDDEKLARALIAGADHGIHYKHTPRWSKTVREVTEGRGADLVVEVGGAGTLTESIGAVRASGRIALVGALTGRGQPLDLLPVVMRSVVMHGIFVGHRLHFEELNRAMTAHRIVPHVDRIFAFDELVAALEHLESGRHFGKVVVNVAA